MLNDEIIEYIYTKQAETRDLSNKILKNLNKHRIEYYKLQEHVNNFLETDTEYYSRLIMMPGLRGVGKTTILYQLYEYLTSNKKVDSKNILYLDVNEISSVYGLDLKTIFQVFIEEIHKTNLVNLDEKLFLFVDEAQLDSNWANYAKLIFDKSYNVFMIFTGSSALELEVNTDATRRIMKEKIFPCSFQEYLFLKYDLKVPSNNFRNLIFNANTESINEAIEFEDVLKQELYKIPNKPEIEFKKFITSYGFPFTLNLDEVLIHKYTNDVIERIIISDLKEFKTFNKISNDVILKLINFLATKKAGETSNSNIAQSLETSTKSVRKILEVLEQSQLIFSVKPYGPAGVMLKKSSEHFFLTPSVKASLNYKINRYYLDHEKCFSYLVENLVGSIFYKLHLESMSSLGLFYDPDDKGVDFVLKYMDKIIPVEVGIGNKTKSQLTIAKKKYNTDYGILISNRTSKIKFENGILYIPLLTFVFMS